MHELPDLAIVPCADDEMLRRLREFDDRFLARTAAISDEIAAERFSRCPSAFSCIIDGAHHRAPMLHGYFIVLPLTVKGVDAVLSGRVKGSRDLTLEDIAHPDAPAPAIYLSVVCAKGVRAQAAAIRGVMQTIRTAYHQRETRVMFVRAATEEGARILQRLTATPFVADGAMHTIQLQPLIE